VKVRKVRGLKPGEPLRPNAARILATRLDELGELAERAVEPGAEEAQHEMRIAAKRLRYALEIFEGCFGRASSEARLVARELQSALGEIHDCDVMLPRVVGIDSVEALLRMRRELLFAQFRELWAQSGTQDALGALGRVVM
jgi:CHAD domain-containing protein